MKDSKKIKVMKCFCGLLNEAGALQVVVSISARAEGTGESGPKLEAEGNALIAYVMVLLDSRCGLPPKFENVMT